MHTLTRQYGRGIEIGTERTPTSDNFFRGTVFQLKIFGSLLFTKEASFNAKVAAALK